MLLHSTQWRLSECNRIFNLMLHFFNYTTSGYLYDPRVAIYIHTEHVTQSKNRSNIHKQKTNTHTRHKSHILGVFPPFNKMTTFIYLNACAFLILFYAFAMASYINNRFFFQLCSGVAYTGIQYFSFPSSYTIYFVGILLLTMYFECILFVIWHTVAI